jgi:mono/diheme cytochrome c family protein
MKTSQRLLLALPALAAVLTGCGGPDTREKSAASPSRAAPSTTEARALFDSLCFTCHGTSGHGDGPGAAALDPKPRSFLRPISYLPLTFLGSALN